MTTPLHTGSGRGPPPPRHTPADTHHGRHPAATPPCPLTQDPHRPPTTPHTHKAASASPHARGSPPWVIGSLFHGTVISAGLGEGNTPGWFLRGTRARGVTSRGCRLVQSAVGRARPPYQSGPSRYVLHQLGPQKSRVPSSHLATSRARLTGRHSYVRGAALLTHAAGPGGAASGTVKWRQPQPLIRRVGHSRLREYRLAAVEPRTAGMSARLIPYRVARRGSRLAAHRSPVGGSESPVSFRMRP